MCGIVGYVGRDGRAVSAEALIAARDTLTARGPDDSGIWRSGNIGLGHRRLAIIDLTPAAHQPMTSQDGRYVIVFNGEIYNFAQIRKDLDEDLSLSWHSSSDTEVILAAYVRWGVECLRRFRGMFAFAIWDSHERLLFVARDRMGVKPLYYRLTMRGLAFASRPRALKHFFSEDPWQLDEQALRFYLESGYIPAPLSAFQGICKLPPAHYFVFHKNEFKIQRYWDFRQIEPEASWLARKEEDLLDELDDLITESVRLRLVSDVPLGTFLSGGIDSSLVTALMARQSGRVKTFTIGFKETRHDESKYAKAVAEHLGTDHYCEEMAVNDLLNLLPAFLQAYDEPFFDHSAFPTMAVSRMARQYVSVSLSGDGGDELFGGYHYYRLAGRLFPLFRIPLAIRRVLAATLGVATPHPMKLLAGLLRQSDVPSAYSFMRGIAKDFDSLIRKSVLERTKGLSALFSQSAAVYPPTLDFAARGMRLDASFILPDDYLQKIDISTMAYSLEAREPLLDHTLVEWAMRLPTAWKLRSGSNKYLLRKLAYRYVPPSILNRPKQGFGAPVEDWLRGPLRVWARDRIEDRTLFEMIPLNQANVRALFRLHELGHRNAHPLLWAVLMLLVFVEHWMLNTDTTSTQKWAT